MAQLKDLIVTGASRFIGNIYGTLKGNADTATALTTSAGSTTQPVYFSSGKPVAITGTIANSTSGNAATATKLQTARTISLTGSVTGSGSFDGSGNLSIATTTNHTHNYAGSSSAGGSATSAVKLDTATAGSTSQPVYFSGGKPVAITGAIANNTTGNAATASRVKMVSTHIASTDTTDRLLEEGIVRFDTVTQDGTSIANDGIIATFGWSANYGAQIWLDDGSSPAQMQVRNRNASSWNPWRKVWMQGDAVTGAVWNDYAEYRESDCKEFGYVLTETGDDTLTKTTERLQPFAGVSSDTWGFSQGETARARTPIAVAGRVLVYTYQNRNNYKPGDCVCAAPGGTVDIMTREEVREWPDRIVGTVSCVPTYEEWGGGEDADREPVKVNGRIWIKVK